MRKKNWTQEEVEALLDSLTPLQDKVFRAAIRVMDANPLGTCNQEELLLEIGLCPGDDEWLEELFITTAFELQDMGAICRIGEG